MSELNENWQPFWGTIYTWFACDKYNRVGKFVNNGHGFIPKCLLEVTKIGEELDRLYEYLYEEMNSYKFYENLGSKWEIDCYSQFMIGAKGISKNALMSNLIESYNNSINKNLSDINIVSNKGLFIYEAVEGYNDGDDYPVGWDGESKMGDYYRYLMPVDKYGTIDILPEELRPYIAVSDTLDFTKDRLLDNDKINEYFPRLYNEL